MYGYTVECDETCSFQKLRSDTQEECVVGIVSLIDSLCRNENSISSASTAMVIIRNAAPRDSLFF